MRFDLKAHRVLIVKLDHPGVILKHRNAPVLVQILGRLKDRLFNQVIEINLLAVVFHIHAALERLMHTVLAPRLCQRLQLHIRRLTVDGAVFVLDRLHLLEIQEHILFLRQAHQLLIAQLANRHLCQHHLVRFGMRTRRLSIRPEDHILDAVIRQNPSRDHIPVGLADIAQQHILAGRPHRLNRPGAHIRQRTANRFGHRIGHAAFQMHLNQRRRHRPRRHIALAQVKILAHRVAQKLNRHPLGKVLLKIRLDQENTLADNIRNRIDIQLTDILQRIFTVYIQKTLLR